MKRIFALLLCLCMVLAGCGGTQNSNAKEGSEVTLDFSYGKRSGEYTGNTDSENLPDGYGIFSSESPSGTKWVYSGQWDHGHQNGYGVTVFDSGKTHFGEYESDNFLGYGGYKLPSGEIVLGKVNDVGLNGIGMSFKPGGATLVGNHENGIASGWCAIYLSGDYDGYVFWGNVVDGNASGFVYSPDGATAPAEYKNGDLHFNTTEFVYPESEKEEQVAAPQRENVTSDQVEKCKSLLLQCKYQELHEFITSLIDDGYVAESESSQELLFWLDTLENIIKKCNVSYDIVEGKTKVVYTGVTDIGPNIYVAPSVATSDWGYATLEYKVGFRKTNWLYFDELSVASQDQKAKTQSYNSYDINRNVVGGSTVEEYVYSYLDFASYVDDEGVIVRFKNSDTRETLDHNLTETEITAISELKELSRLHFSVFVRIKNWIEE